MRGKLSLWIAVIASALLIASPAIRAQNAPAPNDQTIVDEINAKLFADSTLKTRDIRVSSQDAVVTLEGAVTTRLEKAAVDRIASTEPGVVKVVDSLTILSETPPAEAPTAQAPASSQVIPAGTVVTVRMIDSIDSRKNQPGQTFDATVDTAVVTNGSVVISPGSVAKVRLVNAADSGRIEGNAQLQLELISLTVNSTPYQVQSGYYQLHGSSRGKQTAAAAGGGGILGALIGAIAGGGKGAAIGAGSGAAIGAGASVITKGSSIRIPSETKIDFTLKLPLTINAGS